MSKVIEILTAYIELGASQEDIAAGGFAEGQINAYSNFQLIAVLSDAVDWADNMSVEELAQRGWD